MLGAVGPKGAEPDDGVEGLVILIGNMQDRERGFVAETGDPVIAGISQMIEPGEAEIAKIGQDHAAFRDRCQQGPGLVFLILMGIRDVVEMTPELATDIEHAGEFAGQQAVAAGGRLSQGREFAGDRIERCFIEGDDLSGKGSQRLGGSGTERSKLLTGSGSSFFQLSVDDFGKDAHTVANLFLGGEGEREPNGVLTGAIGEAG